MKVSNAASPPQLEFLTHRSHCPSEISKRELLRVPSSLWVNKVRHDIQENPQVSKTKRDCVLPGQVWSKGKEEKAFGPCEERLVKGNFYFIVMLFQHNSIPTFLEEKKIEKPNNCWGTEVKQTKCWSTFPEMDFSKLFIWSSELLEQEKVEKKSSINTFWTFESSGPKAQNIFNSNNSFNLKDLVSSVPRKICLSEWIITEFFFQNEIFLQNFQIFQPI